MRGGLTIGLRDGEVFTHCHAQFVDADGIMRAGHLIPESVIVGAGVTADLYASRDVAMTVLPDTEINFPVFQPQPAAPQKPRSTHPVACAQSSPGSTPTSTSSKRSRISLKSTGSRPR